MKIYRYVEVGADGLVSAKYAFTVKRWGALATKNAREAFAGGAPGAVLDGVMDFALQTDVRYNDLLVDGSTQYFVRGVTDQRDPDARLAVLERVPRETQLTIGPPVYGGGMRYGDGHFYGVSE